MTRRIVVRDDPRTGRDGQLLLRMNDDRDLTNALKLALAGSGAYRIVPGFEASGALAVSCFAVTGEDDAEDVVRATRWTRYGLAQVGDLLDLGCRLVATDVFDGEDLLPLSDRHVDVIACAYPSGAAPYVELSKAERAELRASLEERFNAVLRAFDPRRTVSAKPGPIP
ncbi:MAG: hypothetical protein ACRD0J_12355 [Acidimicrobiales bacterium]